MKEKRVWTKSKKVEIQLLHMWVHLHGNTSVLGLASAFSILYIKTEIICPIVNVKSAASHRSTFGVNIWNQIFEKWFNVWN